MASAHEFLLALDSGTLKSHVLSTAAKEGSPDVGQQGTKTLALMNDLEESYPGAFEFILKLKDIIRPPDTLDIDTVRYINIGARLGALLLFEAIRTEAERIEFEEIGIN